MRSGLPPVGLGGGRPRRARRPARARGGGAGAAALARGREARGRQPGGDRDRGRGGGRAGGGGGRAQPAAGASAPLWGPGRAATLAFPPPYSVCAQRVAGSGAWLFPAADPPVAGQWLCAVPAAVRAAPEEEGGGETKSK